MWIEVTTLAVSNAVTGAAVAYIFDRRLEKRKALYSAGARFFESVGKAMEAIMLAYRNMVDKSQEITRQLRETTAADGVTDNAVAEFRVAVHDYKAALAVHRLYLTPLIPFGGSKAAESDPHAAVITATAAELLLAWVVRIPHAPQPSQVRDECLKWAEAEIGAPELVDLK
jgi:hypothetical protein